MSAAEYNIANYDKYGPVTERFWADLQHQLQIGSEIGLENERLRAQLDFLRNRRDGLNGYEAMYRQMIDNQGPIIRSLRLIVEDGNNQNNAADETAIDPALSVNFFKYETPISDSQASIVSQNNTPAPSPKHEGLFGSDARE